MLRGNKKKFWWILLAFLIIGCTESFKNKSVNYMTLGKKGDNYFYDQQSIKDLHLKHIKNYEVFIKNIENMKGFLALRKFIDSEKNKKYYLILDTSNLRTYISDEEHIKFKFTKTLNNLEDSYYGKTLSYVRDSNNSWSGLNHIKNNGYVLTLDLCPSTKYFDKYFLDFLISKSIAPLYITVSGKWIEKHKEELKYILNKKGSDIIWVNHSYNHYYNPEKINNENFMLNPGNDLNIEVLRNEKVMIENGLIPSPFFRFPGLIADQRLYDQILSYGLIPLGSNAWLAKGEKANNGSVILLHMNGNEKIGHKLFKFFLKQTNLKPTKI